MTQQLNGLLQEVRDYILSNLQKTLPVSAICKTFFVSKTILQYQFKEKYHLSIHAFILQERLERSKSFLLSGDEPIKYIAMLCGYRNVRSFNKAFKKKFSLSPDQYRKEVTQLSHAKNLSTKVTP